MINISRIKRYKPDKKALVFIFFLIITSVFWFLTALGKEYTTQLSYPVRYTNFPEELVLINELPPKLDLTVNSFGYSLLKYSLSRRLIPIVFDVNSFSLNRLPGSELHDFYILSSVARSRIAGQLGQDINIFAISPDTLFFSFSEVSRKKVEIEPILNLNFRQQFMVAGSIILDPDSVVVSGPATIIDTMKTVKTKKLVINGLNESVSRLIDLDEIPQISYSDTRVRVDIPVQQFTESGMKIPVEVLNIPEGYRVKTFPSTVNVSFLVALTDYERVVGQDFAVAVDYNKIVQGSNKLNVEVIKQPDFVRAVRFVPPTVDFIIER